MPPANVRWFERLMYAAFAVGVVSGPILMRMKLSAVAINVAWVAMLTVLVWLAARRRSNVARWVLFALFVLVTVRILWKPQFYLAQPELAAVQVVITVLEFAAYCCVFIGDSKGWFGKGPLPADVSVF